VGLLKERGIETEVFYEVQADPTLSTIEKGTAMLNAFQPDLIIAIGGGSPMDAAKMHCQCPGVTNTIRFNATNLPIKQTTFSQYDRPNALRRY
jgi:alcohol dehydrogenase class IV